MSERKLNKKEWRFIDQIAHRSGDQIMRMILRFPAALAWQNGHDSPVVYHEKCTKSNARPGVAIGINGQNPFAYWCLYYSK